MTREKIEDVLIKMGIPVSIKGFEYIVDAVMLLDYPWLEAAEETMPHPSIILVLQIRPIQIRSSSYT